MDNKERRRYDMFVRVKQFGAENAADFAARTVGAAQFAEVNDVIDLLDQSTSNQAAGFGNARFSFAGKKSVRENLRDDLFEISRTARSMAYKIPHIDEKFQMPHNRGDQQMIAAARAFQTEAAAHETEFVSYGMPADFLADLQNDIAAFETALGATGAAVDSHTAATAEIDEAVRRGMIAVRILNGVVKNVYRNNAGKLAAWTSASHVEKAPKKKIVPAPTD